MGKKSFHLLQLTLSLVNSPFGIGKRGSGCNANLDSWHCRASCSRCSFLGSKRTTCNNIAGSWSQLCCLSRFFFFFEPEWENGVIKLRNGRPYRSSQLWYLLAAKCVSVVMLESGQGLDTGQDWFGLSKAYSTGLEAGRGPEASLQIILHSSQEN